MIKFLESESDLLEGYHVLKELRTSLSEKEFFKRLAVMQKEGYQMLGLEDKGQLVAVAGIIPLTNFYHGKHIYIYDLVTKSTVRSSGYGEKLLDYIISMGKEKGYENITLSSGLQRVDAHRFYEKKMSFDKTSFVFVKSLT
ncbi:MULTISPECIES: GNAT family N-acetyltransferase [Bacillus]|uniref:GNAT family N-acetyltransferase n=1 Tax=Bacillus TaxID=1386 RepID=UPI000BB7854F|nr:MULTISPECIES: GNAT family N-acetyltransferase [Bacillus]